MSQVPRITPVVPDSPPEEPVSIATLKAFLRITGTSEETLLTSFIRTARDMAERITGRAIVEQEFVASWDMVPGFSQEWWDGVRDGALCELTISNQVEIPRPPLISVEAIKLYDNTDTATEVDDEAYYVDASDPNKLGRVTLRMGQIWPATVLRTSNGFQIEYTAGYEEVPADIAHAILLMASWLYKNRGDCSPDGCASSCGAMSFLSKYRILQTI